MKVFSEITKEKGGTIKPLIFNDKLLSLQITYNNYTLIFKDSLLLLPSSLSKLCKSFGLEENKGIFPFKLNNIYYLGRVPFLSDHINVSYDDYMEFYKDYFDSHGFPLDNKYWYFKEEAIKYCELDCKVLYQIIKKFNLLTFDSFNINIDKFPTLSSLSFAIFRKNYINKNEDDMMIHQLHGEISDNIRQSYTGGAVDMYLPIGNDLFAYDVNSLYPYVMANKPMPVGQPTYFEGDIRKIDSKAFGFFYCKITNPEYLEHPIIQTHVKIKDQGIRTLAPLGTWDDMIFSEEMDNAIKYGYKFEILWGYTFNKKVIFKDFVEDLYKIRLSYPKSDPMNYIAKIIMNSLYGRFGMNDKFIITRILDNKSYNLFENDKNKIIQDIIELGNKTLVQYKEDNLDKILDNGSQIHNINIAVASAITAYSRIHMTQFKNNPNYNLFYTDTDSIYIDKPLENELIGKELGLMKLEAIIKKGIFLAPKVYGYITDNNKQIIKVKGLSKNNILTLNDLKDLLIKDSKLELNQEKWFRSIEDSNVTIKDQVYSLKVTGNKRLLVYCEADTKLIGTQPYIINENKEIVVEELPFFVLSINFKI